MFNIQEFAQEVSNLTPFETALRLSWKLAIPLILLGIIYLVAPMIIALRTDVKLTYKSFWRIYLFSFVFVLVYSLFFFVPILFLT